jgi:hypothetical protein
MTAQDRSIEMNQDAMFFTILGLIVLALVLIGPALAVWQYQHPRAVAVHPECAPPVSADRAV